MTANELSDASIDDGGGGGGRAEGAAAAFALAEGFARRPAGPGELAMHTTFSGVTAVVSADA